MSIAAFWEPRLSKPGPSIADPSNTAPTATASHRAAAAAAEAGRWIWAEISVQTAAEGSPVITPPPETPISTTNSTGNTQPLALSSIEEDKDQLVDKLDNLRDKALKSAKKSKKTRTKRAHDADGQSYYHYIYLI